VGTSILAACLFHLAQTTDGSCPIEPTKPERHPAATSDHARKAKLRLQ
jgi:hypothetical protein